MRSINNELKDIDYIILFMRISQALLLAIVGFAAQANAGKKCYALVLGSGDESSAFQVGALQALIDNLPSEDIQYNAVLGV